MANEKEPLHTVHVEEGLFANTAAIVSEIVKHPLTASVVTSGARADAEKILRAYESAAPTPQDALREIRQMMQILERPPRQGHATRIEPTFKLVFLTVVAITVLSFLAEVAMAQSWLPPSTDQHSVIEAADFAWKAGIGAIFGLLGGKQ